MPTARALRLTAGILAAAVLATGCNTVREIAGFPASGEPSVTLKSAEPKWVLIKNPRYGDVASEPQYIWVEEDKMPTTMKSFMLGKSTLLAPPEVVPKYGLPPGGGRISALHKLPYDTTPVAAPASGGGRAPLTAATTTPATRTDGAVVVAAPPPTRGFVVFVDTTRIVIDLTARDGVKLGGTVSLRRDKIPIVHPVTGEMLGELDEEVATGKVIEVRDKFSVVELQRVEQGTEIKIKDRVVLR
jgi:hypothetical protein